MSAAMNEEASLRLAVAFAREAAQAPTGRLCRACVDVVGVAGAGITLMHGRNAGPLCVSSDRIAELEDLQFVSGEGPCQDAHRTGEPVRAARLDAATYSRWPNFSELAARRGVGSVFAYPLRTSLSKVGILTLYKDSSGDLSPVQDADSQALAGVLTETILTMTLASEPGGADDGLDGAVSHRAELHQATGMVAVQLGIPIYDALARIRATAFAQDRALIDVSADIVARRIRLASDGPIAEANGG